MSAGASELQQIHSEAHASPRAQPIQAENHRLSKIQSINTDYALLFNIML